MFPKLLGGYSHGVGKINDRHKRGDAEPDSRMLEKGHAQKRRYNGNRTRPVNPVPLRVEVPRAE
jgi:hypothetical protein